MKLSSLVLIFAAKFFSTSGFRSLIFYPKNVNQITKGQKSQCLPSSTSSSTENIDPTIGNKVVLVNQILKSGGEKTVEENLKAELSGIIRQINDNADSLKKNDMKQDEARLEKRKDWLDTLLESENQLRIEKNRLYTEKANNLVHQTETISLLGEIVDIEAWFNASMIKSDVPLLENFSSYSKSLPVRLFYGNYKPLYKMDFIVRPSDLAAMASGIIKKRVTHGNVRYVSAPSTTGKTASVLPAFLRSTSMRGGGTHYIYLAFANTNDRHFILNSNTCSSMDNIAAMQGAAFIVECVKTLFERPDDIKSYTIDLEASPKLTVTQCSKLLRAYLVDKLGEDFEAWFHLDEHGKMYNRKAHAGMGVAFSRGAMGALSTVAGVTVIATYVERPLLPAVGSSAVCRVPITLPPIDVNQVMSIVPELTINTSDFNSTARRLMASLKCRLGFKLTELKFYPVLHCRGSDNDAEKFLLEFAEAKAGIHHDTISALKECNNICKYNLKIILPKISIDNAVDVLLGIATFDDLDMRQISDIFSLTEDITTFNVPKLLNIYDPNIGIYDIGRNLFEMSLGLSDSFSGTPLEACYFWTLSCSSALNNKLHLTVDELFNIDCKSLKPGRLFPGTDSSVYDLKFLQKSTMYYADEKDVESSKHPLADLFFITDDDILVLIDIYGGNNEQFAEDKRTKLDAWIVKENKKCFIPYKLRGVILAPNVPIQMGKINDVAMVSGEKALILLGGLRQIYQWFE